MKIELLYCEGCPNYLPTLERIKKVLQGERRDAEIRLVFVPNGQTAQDLSFLGSPTVRINGIDIEPTARQRRDFGLMCRRYPEGIPSFELIRAAVHSSLERQI